MNPQSRTPKAVILAVVVFLGVYALAALAGTIWLIERDAQAAMIALISGSGGTALGGLVGMLASTSTDDPKVIAAVAAAAPPADPGPNPGPVASPFDGKPPV